MSDSVVFIKLTPADDVETGAVWLRLDSITGMSKVGAEVWVTSGGRLYDVIESPDEILDKISKAIQYIDGYSDDLDYEEPDE